MNQRTRGKVALITGAGKREGLGFEAARQLAELGFRVLLTARSGDSARARAEELRQAGYDVAGDELNVEEPESMAALSARLKKESRVDVLINNAARPPVNGERATCADLVLARESMETILFGTWRVTQCVLPFMLAAPQPRIVNVSSGAGSHLDQKFGLHVSATDPSYAVAKCALNALTATLAQELRELRVLVNAVCPGFTATFPGAEGLGARPVKESAEGIVWAATLPDDGPTGGLFRDRVALPW